MEGKVDPRRLREACRIVVQRHEILRTTFQGPREVPSPYQVIHDELLPVWWEDDSVRPDLGIQAKANRACDLEAGPLVLFSFRSSSPELHSLAITLPGLCADAGTLDNLVREVAHFYAAGDTSAATLGIPLQYADFAEWQNQLLQGEGEGTAYWRAKGSSSTSVPVLPLERRGAPVGGELASVETRIDSEAAGNLAQAALETGASLSDFLLACWQSLLWRLSDQADIAVARISPGRSRDELSTAFGVFARPLPICVRFSEDVTFVNILAQVREAVAEAERWQEYLATEQLAAPSTSAVSLPVAFEFLQRMPRLAADSVAFSIERLSAPGYPFKAKLVCDWDDDAAALRLEYNSGLLARQDAERIAAYFLRLLHSCVRHPASAICAADLMTAEERRAIVEGFNQTQGDFPLDQCFHPLFEQQVERTPDRVALVFEEQFLTYRELNARANQLACYLRRQGVAANSRVGLFVRRSGDMIVALLGILKAGGAYVPLHPDLPRARLAHQLAETEVRILVAHDALLKRLPDFEGHVFRIDHDWAAVDSLPASNLPNVATANSLLYVIYTSGSTGVPKGVATRHENVVNYTRSICRILGLGEPANGGGLTFANVSTLSADLGNTPIFAALASGGCLHVIADEVLLDGRLYGEYAAAVPVDVLKIAPSHLRALLASGDPVKILPRKHLVVGGERLRWDDVHQIRQFGACAILNHYAPTEVTIGCLTCDVESNGWLESLADVVPLGRPIANTVVYVLDRKGKPVPVGVPGEACFGGAGVSNGYINRPDLTVERFMADPLNPESGLRFYRSGDRARFLPGGVVEFLGREDEQVKIRGFRVELGEIEALLSRHPAVKQAVVVLQESAAGEPTLAAFLLAPERPSSQELREYLLKHVPDYMVPSRYVLVDSFPLNANGKIDRRALAATTQRGSAAQAGSGASGNALEEKLISIWQEVLGRDDIGLDDNFFELGGHSLLATLIISRVREAFRVQVPLRTIFEAQTVAGLAEMIARFQTEAQEEELSRILSEIEGLSDEEARRLLEREP